jgi:hypothetical protein
LLRLERQMTSAAMHPIGDDHCRLLEQWMERIEDDDLTAQTPGIMTSRRSAGLSAPRSCTR